MFAGDGEVVCMFALGCTCHFKWGGRAFYVNFGAAFVRFLETDQIRYVNTKDAHTESAGVDRGLCCRESFCAQVLPLSHKSRP